MEAALAAKATTRRIEASRERRRADRNLVRSGALVIRPEDLGGERAAIAEAERAARYTVVQGARVPADTRSHAAVTGLLSDRPGRGRASDVPLRVATQRALRRQELEAQRRLAGAQAGGAQAGGAQAGGAQAGGAQAGGAQAGHEEAEAEGGEEGEGEGGHRAVRSVGPGVGVTTLMQETVAASWLGQALGAAEGRSVDVDGVLATLKETPDHVALPLRLRAVDAAAAAFEARLPAPAGDLSMRRNRNRKSRRGAGGGDRDGDSTGDAEADADAADCLDEARAALGAPDGTEGGDSGNKGGEGIAGAGGPVPIFGGTALALPPASRDRRVTRELVLASALEAVRAGERARAF